MPPKTPPRFSLNTDLTLGVNAPLDPQVITLLEIFAMGKLHELELRETASDEGFRV